MTRKHKGIVDIERTLGFHTDRGISRQSNGVSLRSLVAGMKEVAHNHANSNIDNLYANVDLRRDIDDLFRTHGPTIWPSRTQPRPSWLVEPSPDRIDGVYPRSLHYDDPNDREILLQGFYDLVVKKCYSRHKYMELCGAMDDTDSVDGDQRRTVKSDLESDEASECSAGDEYAPTPSDTSEEDTFRGTLGAGRQLDRHSGIAGPGQREVASRKRAFRGSITRSTSGSDPNTKRPRWSQIVSIKAPRKELERLKGGGNVNSTALPHRFFEATNDPKAQFQQHHATAVPETMHTNIIKAKGQEERVQQTFFEDGKRTELQPRTLPSVPGPDARISSELASDSSPSNKETRIPRDEFGQRHVLSDDSVCGSVPSSDERTGKTGIATTLGHAHHLGNSPSRPPSPVGIGNDVRRENERQEADKQSPMTFQHEFEVPRGVSVNTKVEANRLGHICVRIDWNRGLDFVDFISMEAFQYCKTAAEFFNLIEAEVPDELACQRNSIHEVRVKAISPPRGTAAMPRIKRRDNSGDMALSSLLRTLLALPRLHTELEFVVGW